MSLFDRITPFDGCIRWQGAELVLVGIQFGCTINTEAAPYEGRTLNHTKFATMPETLNPSDQVVRSLEEYPKSIYVSYVFPAAQQVDFKASTSKGLVRSVTPARDRLLVLGASQERF